MTIDWKTIRDAPAKKEYFTWFIKIRSVDLEGNEVRLELVNPERDGRFEYCDKVKVNETRDEGISRSLRDDFGLELSTYSWGLEENEVKNKKGEWLQRIWVDALVEYKEIKDLEVVGLRANWVITKKKNISDQEALEWLDKKSSLDLALNRFGTKHKAREFIENLYKEGAVKVLVSNIDIDDNGEFADTLIVIMPTEEEKRAKLLEIYNEELRNEFEEEGHEEGQTELTFWWD